MALSIKDPEAERLARLLPKEWAKASPLRRGGRSKSGCGAWGPGRVEPRSSRTWPQAVVAGPPSPFSIPAVPTRSSPTTSTEFRADGDRHFGHRRHRPRRAGGGGFREAHRRRSGPTDLGRHVLSRLPWSSKSRFGEIGGSELDLWLHKAGVEIVPVGAEHADRARRAWRRFGRGRHPAGLNFGDCFSYALASLTGGGDDFAKTDIRPA